MKTRLQFGLVTLVAALTCLAPVTANAQARQRDPYGPSQRNQVAYDAGYRDGIASGERDARGGRPYDQNRDRAYDRGGYGYGDRDSREAFEQGYIEGYRAGYSRWGGGSWGNGPRGAYGYPGGGGYPDRNGYPGGYGNTFAYDRGFRDGYDEGMKAGRGNDRFEPQRERDYRNGDAGYDRRYGPKDAYRQVYRDGFLAGYERGYRESRAYRNRPRWPWD